LSAISSCCSQSACRKRERTQFVAPPDANMNEASSGSPNSAPFCHVNDRGLQRCAPLADGPRSAPPTEYWSSAQRPRTVSLRCTKPRASPARVSPKRSRRALMASQYTIRLPGCRLAPQKLLRRRRNQIKDKYNTSNSRSPHRCSSAGNVPLPPGVLAARPRGGRHRATCASISDPAQELIHGTIELATTVPHTRLCVDRQIVSHHVDSR